MATDRRPHGSRSGHGDDGRRRSRSPRRRRSLRLDRTGSRGRDHSRSRAESRSRVSRGRSVLAAAPAVRSRLEERVSAADVTVAADVVIGSDAGRRHVLETIEDADPLVVVHRRAADDRIVGDERSDAWRRRYETCRERGREATVESTLEAVRAALERRQESDGLDRRVDPDSEAGSNRNRPRAVETGVDVTTGRFQNALQTVTNRSLDRTLVRTQPTAEHGQPLNMVNR